MTVETSAADLTLEALDNMPRKLRIALGIASILLGMTGHAEAEPTRIAQETLKRLGNKAG